MLKSQGTASPRDLVECIGECWATVPPVSTRKASPDPPACPIRFQIGERFADADDGKGLNVVRAAERGAATVASLCGVSGCNRRLAVGCHTTTDFRSGWACAQGVHVIAWPLREPAGGCTSPGLCAAISLTTALVVRWQ